MKKFGLIGENLKYSYSKIIHEELGRITNIKMSYDLLEIKNLNEINLKEYDGLNITIPYKKDIIKKIEKTEKIVSKLQSCNTIIKNEYSYNTDIIGFQFLVEKLKIGNVNRVVIIGSGASCRMVCEVFKDKEIKIISRNNNVLEKEIYGDLLVNTTPLGMDDKYSISPLEEKYVKKFKYVIDLNYNPIVNQLLFYANKNHIVNSNGLYMLVVQAIKAFEIWNDIIIDIVEYEKIYDLVIEKTAKGIALIGMPLSGKSNFFSTETKQKNKYIDLDNYMVNEIGMEIKEYFKLFSEYKFRELESICLKKVIDEGYNLISLGGGIIKNFENQLLLKDYIIIDITGSIQTLKNRFSPYDKSRPLLNSIDDLEKMYKERYLEYKFFQTKKVICYEDFSDKWC